METTNEAIAACLRRLRADWGVTVSVGDPMRILLREEEFRRVVLPLMEHRCAYCMLIKSDFRLFTRCLRQHLFVRAKAEREKAPFCGRCVFGVGEYVYPVLIGGKFYSYVTVQEMDRPLPSGTEERIARRLGIPTEELRQVKRTSLTAEEHPERLRPYLAVLASLLEERILASTVYREGNYADAKEFVERKRLVMLASAYIAQNATAGITVADVARKVHISPSYLQHIFSPEAGCGVHEAILRQQISRARVLLRTTGQPVSAVAYACGFADSNYFSACFKRRTGFSPREYRKLNASE